MKINNIIDGVPHAWHVVAVSNLMVRFYTYQGISEQVRVALDSLRGVDWVREDSTRFGAVAVWHVSSRIPETKKTQPVIEPKPVRVLSHEEEVKEAIVRSVSASIYIGHLQRISTDNGGNYTLSIAVTVNEKDRITKAKTTGSIKMMASSESLIREEGQMELPLEAAHECEECGDDISHLPDHYRYCEDCFENFR